MLPIFSFDVFSNTYSESTFKKMLDEKRKSKDSAAERLKAGRFNKSNLSVIEDKDINYILPNGKVVLGILLPNNKVSPAIKIDKVLYPACVTKKYILVKGEYSQQKNTILCNLEASELAILNDKEFTQKSLHDIGTVNVDSKNNRNKGSLEDDKKIKINKYSSNSKKINNNKKTDKNKKPKSNNKNSISKQSENTEFYFPPSGNNVAKSNTVGAVLGLTKKTFGIQKGTWIEAEILETVNSADSGFIQLRVTKSIVGRHSTLPSNSIFFANKAFNASSSRLEGSTNSLILPSGSEIDGITAFIHSTDKSAGLAGAVVRQRGKRIENQGKNILLQLAARSIPDGGTGAATVLADGMDNTLNEISNEIEEPKSFIRIQPQKVLLRVSESF